MDKKLYDKTKYENIFKHKNNGTYAVDLSLGYDQYHKRLRTTKTGFKTEKEAREFLRNEEERKRLKTSLTSNSNFEDGLEEYYEYCLKQKRLKYNTIINKRRRFNNNILPFFAGKKLVKITDKEIVEFHDWLDQKKLKEQTKNTIHKQLSAYFNWLVIYKRIIAINPCLTVKNFKIPKTDIIYYTIDEINRLFKSIEEDKRKSKRIKLLITAILKLFFFNGLRVGELFGIKIKDVKADLVGNSEITESEVAIDLSQTVYYTKGGWVESDGKTDGSLERIWVGKNVILYLKQYIQYMQENYGIRYKPDDYIFLNPNTNKIYSQETIRGYFNYFIEKANIKKIALKDLRHSCATFLLSLGYTLEEVKDKLRHASFITTEKFYATFYEEVRRTIAKNLDKFA